MQNHVKKLILVLSVFLLTMTTIGTVFGQTNGKGKTLSRIDSIVPPKRITYLQENGVFLNEQQERITLEKLLWKEQYRQDAVSMYWVNKALEERLFQVIDFNKTLKDDLQKAEVSVISATSNMEHYRKLYKDTESQNTKLKSDNQRLKTNNRIFKFTTVSLSIFILVYSYELAR